VDELPERRRRQRRHGERNESAGHQQTSANDKKIADTTSADNVETDPTLLVHSTEIV